MQYFASLQVIVSWRLQSREREGRRPSHTLFLVVVVRLCRTTTTRKNHLGRLRLPKPHLRRDFATAMLTLRNVGRASAGGLEGCKPSKYLLFSTRRERRPRLVEKKDFWGDVV